MPLIVADNSPGVLPTVPEDQHVARCVLVAEIGTQQSPFGTKRQCVVAWELPDCRYVFDEHVGPESAMLSRFFTLSLAPKSNLRQVLEAWRGRAFSDAELSGFDLEKLLTIPCLLQVLHKTTAAGDVKATVSNVSKLPKGLQCGNQHNACRFFTFAESDHAAFERLPEWIRKQITQAEEYPAWLRRTLGTAGDARQVDQHREDPQYDYSASQVPDDEVPF